MAEKAKFDLYINEHYYGSYPTYEDAKRVGYHWKKVYYSCLDKPVFKFRIKKY